MVKRISRRALLSTLLGGSALADLVDPEKLLWVPGKKLISIPRDRYFPVWFGYMLPFATLLNAGPDPVMLDGFALISRPPYYYRRIGNAVESGEQFELDTLAPLRGRATIDTRFQVLPPVFYPSPPRRDRS